MVFNAVVCLLIGLPMLLSPVRFMSLAGLNLNSAGMVMTQLYASALLGNSLVAWFSRKDTGSISLHATVMYLFVYNGINSVVILFATLNRIMDYPGYVVAGLFLFFMVSYGFSLTSRYIAN